MLPENGAQDSDKRPMILAPQLGLALDWLASDRKTHAMIYASLGRRPYRLFGFPIIKIVSGVE